MSRTIRQVYVYVERPDAKKRRAQSKNPFTRVRLRTTIEPDGRMLYRLAFKKKVYKDNPARAHEKHEMQLVIDPATNTQQAEAFLKLWELHDGVEIEKERRYRIDHTFTYNDKTYTAEVHYDKHTKPPGIIWRGEIEFSDGVGYTAHDAEEAFRAAGVAAHPPFFKDDVTEDLRFHSSKIARGILNA